MTPEARRVWRDGIFPQLTIAELVLLKEALERNEPTLIQGETVCGEDPFCMDDEPKMACLIGYAGWHGQALGTCIAVENYFEGVCNCVDRRLGETGAAGPFMNWFDSAPREDMIRDMLEEVNLALEQRKVVAS